MCELSNFFTLHFLEMFKHYNPNPTGKNVGDCVVRSIAKATGNTWDDTYIDLCMQGLVDADLPSANAVWGTYLWGLGFRRYIAPDTCPHCYTVAQFAQDHPVGTYIAALSGHVVCVQDGVIYDSWDSSNEIVLYFWQKG